jgi:hypothetical protein
MNRNEILGTLRMKGFSLSSWAESSGYNPASARRVVARALAGKTPKRGTAADIWAKLLFTIKGVKP